jgi:hypothetical protein
MLHQTVRVIKVRRMRLAGHAARMGEMRNSYNILVGKREGKSPVEISRCRWEDNIRIDLKGKRVGKCELDTSGSG